MVELSKLREGMRVRRIKHRLPRNVEYDDYSIIPIGAEGTVYEWNGDFDIDGEWDDRYVYVAWDKRYSKTMSSGCKQETYYDDWLDTDNFWRIHPAMLELIINEKQRYDDLVKKIKYLDKRFLGRKHVQSR